VKQTLRNTALFGVFGLTCLGALGACSSEATPSPGFNNGGSAGTFSSGGTTGGSFGTGGGTGGAGMMTPITGGTFGSGTAGTPAAGGTAGATATGGAGGTTAGTAGTASGGTGGSAPTIDFPANCPMPAASHAADKLTRTCWKASATECSLGNDAALVNPPSNVIDADVATRFSTGSKMDGSQKFSFDIDMGKAVMINGVSTTTAAPMNGGAGDIPPNIQVAVSTDGTTWTPVACTTNALNADIAFAATSARYVRLVQHGTADAWWSMGDVNVYRSGADDTCGEGATTTACTSIGMADMATCCGKSNKL
jgi:hypothetical protein